MGRLSAKSALYGNRSLRGGGQRVGSCGHSGQAKKYGDGLDHGVKFPTDLFVVLVSSCEGREILLFFYDTSSPNFDFF